MYSLAGIDIGGTKCAISLGERTSAGINIIEKKRFPTPKSPQQAIALFLNTLEELTRKHPDLPVRAIGISCGGPLESGKGLILSPPNLPNWDRIDVITPFKERFNVPVQLQNDANACAIAEWKWGAGKGYKNMVFLTFGTGMGAGLILDGKLYSGTNDMAGEIGHVRMEDDGPIGYGKPGAFAGFCSGGSIAKLAKGMIKERLKEGFSSSYWRSEDDLQTITTQKIGEAAQNGDRLALEIFHIVARKLGQGLSILIDILNPECIVIGSIYVRQRSILEPIMLEEVKNEALSRSLSVCRIVPAELGENVGDFAALSVALNALE